MRRPASVRSTTPPPVGVEACPYRAQVQPQPYSRDGAEPAATRFTAPQVTWSADPACSYPQNGPFQRELKGQPLGSELRATHKPPTRDRMVGPRPRLARQPLAGLLQGIQYVLIGNPSVRASRLCVWSCPLTASAADPSA